MINRFWRALAALIMLALPVSAQAAMIEFSATGLVTGVGGGDAYVNTPFTATAIADTGSLSPCVGPGGPIAGCHYLVNTSLTISLPGTGAFQLTNPTISVVNNAQNTFIFSEVFSQSPFMLRALMVLNITGAVPDFATYDLVSNLGPLSTSALVHATDLPPAPGQTPILTDAGPFIVSTSTRSDSTFGARLLGAPAVPEPATWAMMLLGFGLIGAALRHAPRAVRA